MKIPIADIKTGEISGAEPGTFEYFHELAHLEFNKSNFGKNFQYFAQMSEFFTVIFLAVAFFVNIFKYFAVVTSIAMIFFLAYEEIWCNYSAQEKLRKV